MKSPRINKWFSDKKDFLFRYRFTIFAVFVGIIVGVTVYFITNLKSKNNENFNPKDKLKKPNTTPNFIRITGKSGNYVDLDKTSALNFNSSDQTQKGCWSLDAHPNWKESLKDRHNCAVASISLPHDVKATSYTSQGGWDGLCNQMKIEDIPAGVQNYTLKTHPNGTAACGFLFSMADSHSGSHSSERTAYEKGITSEYQSYNTSLVGC